MIEGYSPYSRSLIVHMWRDHAHNPDLLVPKCGGTFEKRELLIKAPLDGMRRCKLCAMYTKSTEGAHERFVANSQLTR